MPEVQANPDHRFHHGHRLAFFEDATDAWLAAAHECPHGQSRVVGHVQGYGFEVSDPADPVPQATPDVLLIKGSAIPLALSDEGWEISAGILGELVRRAEQQMGRQR